MGLISATIFFTLLVAGWIALPFIPAIAELRRRSDADPLRVVHRSEVDIRHFANGFRQFLSSECGGLLHACRLENKIQKGELEDGTPYMVLPGNTKYEVPSDPDEPDAFLTIACGDLELPGDMDYPLEIYSEGNLVCGDKTTLRAALADQTISLGNGCTSYRWLHANREFKTGADCQFFGRISSDDVIRMGDACRFERLHAPRIEFGGEMAYEKAEWKLRPFDTDQSNLMDDTGGRYLYKKDLKIPDGCEVNENIVVTGRLSIGEGCLIKGNLKSHGDMIIGEGVRIQGTVVSGRNLKIENGCEIDGPVVSENKVLIGSACVFGSREVPTTVSAKGIRMGRGVVAYGTVWGGGS
jgi:hypothetical protein